MAELNIAHVQSMATVAALAVVLPRWVRRRVARVRTAPRDALFVASLLILASYTLWTLTVPTAQAWGQLSLMTLYVAVGWAAYRWPERARDALVGSAMVVMVATFISYDGTRAGGILNPNVAAAAITQAAPHLAGATIWALGVTAMILTGGRAAILSAAIVGLAAWLGRISSRNQRLAAALIVLGVITVAVPVLIYLRPGSVVDRLQIWQDALELIAARPLLGWGLGGFALHAPRMGWYMHAHNLLLNVAVEQGVIGLTLWLWWLGAGAWLLHAHYRRHGVKVLQAVVVAYLLHQTVDVIWTVPVGSMVAANLALLARGLEES